MGVAGNPPAGDLTVGVGHPQFSSQKGKRKEAATRSGGLWFRVKVEDWAGMYGKP